MQPIDYKVKLTEVGKTSDGSVTKKQPKINCKQIKRQPAENSRSAKTLLMCDLK